MDFSIQIFEYSRSMVVFQTLEPIKYITNCISKWFIFNVVVYKALKGSKKFLHTDITGLIDINKEALK